MTNSDRPLLELLRPIFYDYADVIEAVLPVELRSKWRQVGLFVRQTKGRKALDHHELLLAMAEMDAEAMRPTRELAAAVLARFPVTSGAGHEARIYVTLPDGSRPARRDLLDRLVRDYGIQKSALLEEITVARRLADRMRKRAAQLVRKGVSVPSPGTQRKQNAAFIAKLSALRDTKRAPRVTAYQADQAREASKEGLTPLIPPILPASAAINRGN
ncbi:hypothetical protein JMJ56_27505 [Belnapia sp. T18]|uniref:Uncharacterized protein n=1 Tax=Belnapia arida TaxID=2804533 RepID=A0ABS1UAM0_9PROT|nr:hypothetical protein [Belnapia arida]MBL6081733.1 hypothetical protein [Belnapia arida]